MTIKDKKDQPLKSTLAELQKAFDEWDALTNEKATPLVTVSTDESNPARQTEIQKKTREILEKLNAQIKELGL